jgi:glycosyltransferase involved in cell wall biosynthesis
MRIGLIIYGDLETLSGGYLYDRKLFQYLQCNGDTVEIFSLPHRRYAENLLDNFSRALLERLQRSRLDLLLQDELNHPSLFYLNRRLRARWPSPVVAIVHHLRASEQHPRFLLPLYRWVEKRYLQTLDGIIYNSQTTRKVVASLGLAHLPNVVAQPAGDRLAWDIDEAHIQQRAEESGPLRLVFLGNVIPRKGLHFLLSALEKLPPDSWRLAVVGDLHVAGRYGQAMVERVARLGWQDQVEFTGPIRDAALMDILADGQVLALPSSYEGYGIAYLEGMAMGLPAIATTSGAAGEIITHAVDGFLVDSGDVSRLAETVRRLHLHRPLLAQLGLNARKRYLRHPTWADSMAKCRAFIHNFPAA